VLNPPGETRVERFGQVFGPGDKVMQVENDYEKEVYPEFKWSSQHLERGGCDDCSEAAFGSVWARRVALAWSAFCCAA
jgi:hypothetical protein